LKQKTELRLKKRKRKIKIKRATKKNQIMKIRKKKENYQKGNSSISESNHEFI